jgi:hypothetical protein
LAYTEPYPTNIVELEDQMMEHRRIAVNEWIEQFKKYGASLIGAI